MNYQCKCGFKGTIQEVVMHLAIFRSYVPSPLLVASGLITQEQYDKAVEEYNNYLTKHGKGE